MRLGNAVSPRRLLRVVSIVLLALFAVHTGFGQAIPAASGSPPPSRVDFYVGYGYFHPFTSDIAEIPYPSVPAGAVFDAAGYFTRHFGVELEGQVSPKGPQDNNCIYTAQAGPILRTQRGRLVPFFHALGGAAVVGGPRGQECNVWGWGVTGGGGLDIILPAFHDRLALRPVQADFMYSHIDNGPVLLAGDLGGLGEIYAFRFSAGLVLRLGAMSPPEAKMAATLNCSVQPAEAFPGDPVTITGNALNVNPKHSPTYVWISSGGKFVSNGPTAAVDTTGVAPGTYAVTGKLVEGEPQRLITSCSTSFTVRNYDPPTIACSADKSAINSGDPVTITAMARSPQNRPLTYAYTSTSGSIAGEGTSTALSTVGANPGNITVTCLVMDDRGQKATATASIVVATPALPPTPVAPKMQRLCTITFDRDKKRPDRVDNESKACLDDVALSLNREAADRLLLVGAHVAGENGSDAAIRAMNAAQYLTHEKGIDPARLDLRIGGDSSRSVTLMLVPPGASEDVNTATSFDSGSIKSTGEAYGTAAKPAAKKRPSKPKPATPPQ